jgi:hypothetical protein
MKAKMQQQEENDRKKKSNTTVSSQQQQQQQRPEPINPLINAKAVKRTLESSGER